jgi:hypothetical protein
MITMTAERRLAMRVGIKIHGHLLGTDRANRLQDLPYDVWQQCCRIAARLRFAQSRNWQVAAQSLTDDLHFTTGCLVRELNRYREQLPPRRTPKCVASASEIAADLAALEQEFDEVELDLKERTVSVLTTPIVLEDVHLGPFRIVLSWEQIGSRCSYKLIAEEPNTAHGVDDVTHPHVRDMTLCEGEGKAAIRAALSGGRLLDFFVLVRQILETYNSASAHVALSQWEGYSCKDCGSSMSREDSLTCERCDDYVCSDCSCSCNRCGRYVCNDCTATCAGCDNSFCKACITVEAGTSRLVCDKCLEAQQERENNEADEIRPEDPAEEPPSPTAPEPAAAAADAVRVGETAVSPRPRRNGSRRVRPVSSRRPAARRGRTARAAAVLAGDGEV